MNVDTVTIPKETAARKVADIKALKRSQRTEEDDALLALYTSISKHNARVITLSAAFRQAGLNDLDQPRIAVAQGDWTKVFCTRYGWNGGNSDASVFGYRFTRDNRWRNKLLSDTVALRPGSYDRVPTEKTLSTTVPHVPANIRPTFHLRNYHILFEVEKWTVEMPVDPFLLKHVTGDTYAVIAEWELTDLEASILGGMRN